jgi:hypothetical protein
MMKGGWEALGAMTHRRGNTDGVVVTSSGGSGGRRVAPTDLRASPRRGGSPGPVHEERRSVRRAVDGEPRRERQGTGGGGLLEEEMTRKGLGQEAQSFLL